MPGRPGLTDRRSRHDNAETRREHHKETPRLETGGWPYAREPHEPYLFVAAEIRPGGHQVIPSTPGRATRKKSSRTHLTPT